jgi:putative transcriptional regulator
MKVATKKAKTKAKVKEQQFMSDDAFAELELSLNQAIAYEHGAREGYRVTERKIPPKPKPRSKAKIVQLRKKLEFSQSTFARFLNVSVKTIQAWEQGTRKPSDAALKLLAVAEKHPEDLFDSE